MFFLPRGLLTPQQATIEIMATAIDAIRLSSDELELVRRHRKANLIKKNCEQLGVPHPKEIEIYFEDEVIDAIEEIEKREAKIPKWRQYAFNELRNALCNGHLTALIFQDGTREQLDLPAYVWWQSDEVNKIFDGEHFLQNPEVQFQITKTESVKGFILLREREVAEFCAADPWTVDGTSQTENPDGSKGKRRGPAPRVKERVVQKMRLEIEAGITTATELASEKEEALASRYEVSRDTIRKARNEVLS
tara:strand:- start:6109 stop:6855 length:747 start_codon:yes stop_codon:yes gene_type:complete